LKREGRGNKSGRGNGRGRKKKGGGGKKKICGTLGRTGNTQGVEKLGARRGAYQNPSQSK